MSGQLFDGPRVNGFFLLPEEVVIIGLDTDDGPEHPNYDPRINIPVLDEDVANVLVHGVLKPGLIRKEQLSGGKSRAIVLDGRQRVRWARAANAKLRESYSGAELEKRLIRVPFIPKQQVGDANAQMRMGVAANRYKASDFMMKAEEANRMLSRGISKKDVAIDFGVSPQALDQWLQVLTLGKKMQDMVRSGTMSPSTAIQYSDMSEEEQDKVIADCERLGVTIGASEAKTQRAARKRSNGAEGHEVRRPIGAGTLRKLMSHETFVDSLEPNEAALLKWILGEANQDRRIKGLRAALKDIGYLGKDED